MATKTDKFMIALTDLVQSVTHDDRGFVCIEGFSDVDLGKV